MKGATVDANNDPCIGKDLIGLLEVADVFVSEVPSQLIDML